MIYCCPLISLSDSHHINILTQNISTFYCLNAEIQEILCHWRCVRRLFALLKQPVTDRGNLVPKVERGHVFHALSGCREYRTFLEANEIDAATLGYQVTSIVNSDCSIHKSQAIVFSAPQSVLSSKRTRTWN